MLRILEKLEIAVPIPIPALDGIQGSREKSGILKNPYSTVESAIHLLQC